MPICIFVYYLNNSNMSRFFFFLFVCLPSLLSAQWTLQNINTTNNLRGVHYYDANNIFISRTSDMTLTNNGGVSWMHQPIVNLANSPYLGTTLYDAFFFSPTTGVSSGGVLSGNTQMVLRTTNAALNWAAPYASNAGNYPREIHKFSFSNATDGYAVGSNGVILRTTDAGVSWTVQNSGTTAELYTVVSPSSTTAFIGANGRILKTTNAGLSWSSTLFPGVFFKEIWFYNSSIGYAAGTNGLVGVFYKTTDGGTTWTSVRNPISYDVYELTGNGLDTIYLTTGNRMYYSTNGGTWWNYFPSTVGYILNDIDFLDNTDSAYAVGNNGVVLKTGNAGGNVLAPVSLCAASSGTTVCQNGTLGFSNYGNPAWTYEWLLDNVTTATTYNATLAFPNGGNHQVKLVAFNGTYRDTSAAINITVNTVPQLGGIAFTATPLSICPTGGTNAQVTNSQPSWGYQLLINNVPYGAPLIGNTGTLYFYVTGIMQTSSLVMQATSTNGCGTNVVNSSTLNLVVNNVNQALPVFALHDTICSSRTDSIVLSNSISGVNYTLRVGNTPVGATRAGNGGTLYFPTGAMAATTTFNILGVNGQGCQAQLLTTPTVVVSIAQADIGNTFYNVNTNTSLNMINNSVANSYVWNFGPNALPATSTANAPSVTYTTTGTQQIILQANSTYGCVSYDTLNIQASAMPAVGPGTLCMNQNYTFAYGNGNTGYEILDYCTDINGNTYATGYFDSSWYGQQYNLVILKFNAAGNLVWSHKQNPFNYFPNSYGNSFGTSICVDSLGNFYVGGNFSSYDLTIGSLTLATTNYNSAMRGFIVKFNAAGQPQWAIEGYANGPVSTGVTDLVCRNNNDIYFSAVGSGYISYRFPNNTQFFGDYISIAHFNASGALLSFVSVPQSSSNPEPLMYDLNPSYQSYNTNRIAYVGPRLAIQANNLYVAGVIRNTLVFGNHTVSNQGGIAGFIAKLNMNTQTWTDAFHAFSTTAYFGTIPVFAVDLTGDFYWAWSHNSSYYPETTTVGANVYSGTQYSFIAKFSPSGTPLWVNATTSAINVRSLVSLTNGQVVGYGDTPPPYIPITDFATLASTNGTLYGFPSQGNIDAFIFSYSNAGNLLWARSYQGVNQENALVMAPFNCDQVALIGQSNGATTFGNTTIATGANNLFVSKFSISGNCAPATCYYPLVASVSSAATTVCPNTCTTVSAQGFYGTPPYSYHWMPGNMSTASASICPAATTTYTCVISDANGDSSIQTIPINTYPAPTISIAGASVVCLGDSTVLTANGGQSYVWQPNAVVGQTYTATPQTTFTYTVNATDLNGCVGAATHTVATDTIPRINIYNTASSDTLCDGTPFALYATGASSYLWEPYMIVGDTFYWTAYGTLTYTVVGTNTCSGRDSLTIFVNPRPTVTLDLSPIDTLCYYLGTIQLTGGSPSGGVFSGQGVINGNIFDPLTAGLGYHIIYYQYTDSNGCSETAYSYINVDICNDLSSQTTPWGIQISPNPIANEAQINCTSCSEVYTLVLLDARGQRLQTVQFASKNNQLDMSKYAAGVYWIQVFDQDKVHTQKIIKGQ